MARIFEAFLIVAVAVYLYYKHGLRLPRALRGPRQNPAIEDLLANIDVSEDLQDFLDAVSGQPDIIKLVDGVYAATHYGFCHVFMVEGPDGMVVLDTTESVATGRLVAARYREITNKPIKAIVYTHYHFDHISGTRGFLEGQDEMPEIWSHPLLEKYEERSNLRTGAYTKRLLTHLGTFLESLRLSENFLHSPINLPERKVRATHRLQGERQNVTLGGMEMTLIHLPGETEDMIGVWIPEKRVLHIGDTMYAAFPSLYSVRGSRPRDILDWIASLDTILALRPHCILAGHMMPVCGDEAVRKVVSDYRDAVKYTHDQAVRHMNRGLHPDEVARLVTLPPEYDDQPLVRDVYTPRYWDVRGVIAQYSGCYTGRAEEMNPLTPAQRARSMVGAFGRDQLLDAAERALQDGDAQFALELSTHAFYADRTDPDAIGIRGQALRAMAVRQNQFATRNYYMTAILEDRGALTPVNHQELFLALPPYEMLLAMTRKVKAEDVHALDTVTCIKLADVGEVFSVHVHRGVADLAQELAPNCDVTVTTTEDTWRHLVGGSVTAAQAAKSKDASFKGDKAKFQEFLAYFDTFES